MTIPNLLKAAIALGITRIGFTLMLIVIFLMCASAFLVAPVTGFVLPACFAMAAERILEPGFKSWQMLLSRTKARPSNISL